MAVMFVFTGCEKEDPVIKNPESSNLFLGLDVSSMQEHEILAHFRNYDFSNLESNYDDVRVISSSSDDLSNKPRISTRASCQAAGRLRKLSGTATGYSVLVLENGTSPIAFLNFTGNPSQILYYSIDDTKSYDFVIGVSSGGGSSEDFSFNVVRPSGGATSYWFYGIDATSGEFGEITDIDYFVCP